MRKKIFAVLAGLGLLSLLAFHQTEGAENSCVSCHRDLPAGTFIGSKYQTWKSSIHAQEGITCDRCHGGKPSASQKETAHTGVYNSGHPLSRVYFKSVPGTCGACHRRDFNAFKSSAHYALLEKSGAGPTCVTCHESHSTRIISPSQLPATCTQCHNERMQINPQVPAYAQSLLLSIDETSLLVRLARKQIPEGERAKLQEWREAEAMMEIVRDVWHAFNLKEVQTQILKVYAKIKGFWVQER